MQTDHSKVRAPYSVGDQVVHVRHGAGQIVAIEEKQLSGRASERYYVVALSKSKVWVPVASIGSASLRPVVSKTDLAQYRALLTARPTSLKADKHQRQRELADRGAGGSFEDLCLLVRDLSAHGWRKHLGDSETAMLRKAQDALSREWSTASGLALPEASKLIAELLLVARQIHDPSAVKATV
jgi:CarD family transcriptional regulator